MYINIKTITILCMMIGTCSSLSTTAWGQVRYRLNQAKELVRMDAHHEALNHQASAHISDGTATVYHPPGLKKGVLDVVTEDKMKSALETSQALYDISQGYRTTVPLTQGEDLNQQHLPHGTYFWNGNENNPGQPVQWTLTNRVRPEDLRFGVTFRKVAPEGEDGIIAMRKYDVPMRSPETHMFVGPDGKAFRSIQDARVAVREFQADKQYKGPIHVDDRPVHTSTLSSFTTEPAEAAAPVRTGPTITEINE